MRTNGNTYIFRDAGSNLLSLINDVLDLSKIEAGHLDLDITDFDLYDLVQRAAELVAVRASEKNLELAYQIQPDVPTSLVGDPNRLRQVLLNLLGNAIKFTDQGEVVLRVECDPKAEGSGNLLFTVRDTGIGIPADKFTAIFERFTQVDSSMTRPYSGTGLGLTISRRRVERMGGRMWVDSELSRGSTFSFTAKFAAHVLRQRVLRQQRRRGEQNALKMAFRMTSRPHVAAVEGSFHGRTAAAGTITWVAREKWHAFPRTPFDVSWMPRRDIGAIARHVTQDTAAVIVEPVQGVGGAFDMGAEFLQALRSRCDETGALLIFDEVQCGMGRVGQAFAAGLLRRASRHDHDRQGARQRFSLRCSADGARMQAVALV